MSKRYITPLVAIPSRPICPEAHATALMKDHLPTKHGLTQILLNSPLIHRLQNEISITDAQFAALEAGVARGESLLLVSPTSTGKTEVGLLGIASWLSGANPMSQRAIYLVSHRALARQKFNELNTAEFLSIFNLSPSELAMSNGDLSVDGTNAPTDDPLSARLLIATYEKFLALLSASGLRQDMSHYCIVADEFQLIGDPSRGQDVEILFTIIKKANCGQFIGLSAVLHQTDLATLSDWMDATQVQAFTREIPLSYELRLPSSTYLWSTEGVGPPATSASKHARDPISVLNELEIDSPSHFPAAVFCMTKRRVEQLSRQWSRHRTSDKPCSTAPSPSFEEPTALSEALAVYMPQGFAMHTADLIEDERTLVEQALDNDQLPVVFATTTLAQGLNYSFKTVIFDDWSRYNFQRRQPEPISRSEFHNIAGRAGRLGRVAGHTGGNVIYFANTPAQTAAAALYLSSELEETVVGRIDPNRFDQVALQLLAAELVQSADECLLLLRQSLSSHIARDRGRRQDELWEERLNEALNRLNNWGFINNHG